MELKQYINRHNIDLEVSPQKFFVGDIESSLRPDNTWSFELGVISNGDIIESFNDPFEMWDYLNYEFAGSIIYFHNLDFDSLFFLGDERIAKELEDTKLISSGNLMISFKIGTIEFRNSLTLFPMSLKKLVTTYGNIHDEKWEQDKSNVLDLDRETLELYCSKDVLYLLHAIEKLTNYFKDNWNMGLKLTLPSQAFNLWERYFMPEYFLSSPNRNEFFNDGYYFGGHTEKFKAGQKVFRHVSYYDVNSLYPFIMRNIKFGNSKLRRIRPTKDKVKRLLKAGTLFYALVTLNIDSEELRFFPELDPKTKSNKYRFGIGQFKVSEKALQFVLKWGSWENIVSIEELLVYENKATLQPFKEYVDLFYSLRKSDPNNNLVFKLLLNSLYGKFGQKLERQSKVINSTSDERALSYVRYGEIEVATYKETETRHYMIKKNRLDVAGKITEHARLYMGDIINSIRALNIPVIYTDTDSIMIQGELENTSVSHLIDSSTLGLLKNEIGYKDNLILLGVKTYHFYKSGKKATKGIKKMELQDFRDIIRGKSKFINTRFSRFNSLITKGFFGVQELPYNIKTITERLD